jgi:Ca2+-binding EF-hand superfamily protein
VPTLIPIFIKMTKTEKKRKEKKGFQYFCRTGNTQLSFKDMEKVPKAHLCRQGNLENVASGCCL